MRGNNKVKYVTFQMRPNEFEKTMGTKYYAIKCDNEKQIKAVFNDAFSINGATYIRVNNGGARLNNRIILSIEDYNRTFKTRD